MSSKSTSDATKRKGNGVASDAPSSKKIKKDKTSTSAESKSEEKSGFSMLTVKDIRVKIEQLCKKVPEIPEGNFLIINDDDNGDDNKNKDQEPVIDETATRKWAAQMQVVLEEFNLHVCCIGTATYKWGTERSGAGDQNLNLLLSEISSSQEHLSTAVTPRLTNLLAPVVDLVIEKTVTYKQEKIITNGDEKSGDKDQKPILTEVKENHFTPKLVDPAFLSLCHKILARNAPLLRHVVLSNLHKLLNVMKDYLKAHESEMQHGRSFAY